MRTSRFLFMAAALLFAAASCGPDVDPNPTGTGASQRELVTSAEGGVIALEGTTLDVPPGAVPGDRAITITSSQAAAPGDYQSVSPVFIFEPAGLVFTSPVTVQIPIQGNGRNADSLVIYWTVEGSETEFEPLETTRVGDFLVAQVTHFSRGFASRPRGNPDGGRPEGAGRPENPGAQGRETAADAGARGLEVAADAGAEGRAIAAEAQQRGGGSDDGEAQRDGGLPPAASGERPEAGSGSAPQAGSGSLPEAGSGSIPEAGSGSIPEAGAPDAGAAQSPPASSPPPAGSGSGAAADAGVSRPR